MKFASAREWLFSAKTFAAAMIALYIGLALELPRPYWAMATVYIVSNPFVGATRSRRCIARSAPQSARRARS